MKNKTKCVWIFENWKPNEKLKHTKTRTWNRIQHCCWACMNMPPVKFNKKTTNKLKIKISNTSSTALVKPSVYHADIFCCRCHIARAYKWILQIVRASHSVCSMGFCCLIQWCRFDSICMVVLKFRYTHTHYTLHGARLWIAKDIGVCVSVAMFVYWFVRLCEWNGNFVVKFKYCQRFQHSTNSQHLDNFYWPSWMFCLLSDWSIRLHSNKAMPSNTYQRFDIIVIDFCSLEHIFFACLFFVYFSEIKETLDFDAFDIEIKLVF